MVGGGRGRAELAGAEGRVERWGRRPRGGGRGRRGCSVFTVYVTCNVISHVQYVLYLYISTSRSKCAVPNMAVFCSSLFPCFPGLLLGYCLRDFETVPVARHNAWYALFFTFDLRCTDIVMSLCS
jgi:hypothetical protein